MHISEQSEIMFHGNALQIGSLLFLPFSYSLPQDILKPFQYNEAGLNKREQLFPLHHTFKYPLTEGLGHFPERWVIFCELFTLECIPPTF